MKTVFLRVLEADDKAAALIEAVQAREPKKGSTRFEVDPESFSGVVRSPFAYWVSDHLRSLYQSLPMFETADRAAKVGLQTSDDFRFVRAWWEERPETISVRWFSFAKGGRFSPFYADVHLLVNWESRGREVHAFNGVPLGSAAAPIRNPGCYFRPGLTWPVRTNGFSIRAMPAGCLFGHKGPAVFVETDLRDELMALAALMNSLAFYALLSLQLARTQLAQSHEVGLIQSTPVPVLPRDANNPLAAIARRAWSLRRALDACVETSHAFKLPALLQVSSVDLPGRVSAWFRHVGEIHEELVSIQSEVDERCFKLYGIDAADRRVIAEGFGAASDARASETAAHQEREPAEEFVGDAPSVDSATLAAELVSWAVGVAFGRFDVRLATGARELPPEPGPFDALPDRSPGMLSQSDRSPITDPPESYPIAFPENGVLVDDPGDPRDLTAAVRTVFDTVFGTQADRWWGDTAALLDAKGRGLREWLSAGFFEHHIKQYSKSRRRAPVLWQLGTQSGRYSVWLQSHRLTPDSMFQVQNRVVDPKLSFEERALTRLVQTAGPNPSASERAEIARQAAFVEEVRTMLDDVKRMAPLWNPSLDDGVVLTMAPLWRLVSQHKSWQRELRTRWKELAAGKYDWSHIAMNLWPERVVPKCATDRSFAIAHGLEEVFWTESDAGAWTPSQVDQATVQRLIEERSSAAVAAAVAQLEAG